MNPVLPIPIPDSKEFRQGYEIYNEREKHGPIYFKAMEYLSKRWGDPAGMAEGVSTLIRGWNYLFANFDFEKLVMCIETNLTIIEGFKKRNINSLGDADTANIQKLFNEFLDALQRTVDSRKSPVSVAKALHPLAPNFFPLWDNSIADAYECQWGYSEIAAVTYIQFCNKMNFLADKVRLWVPNPDDRSLLKRIDEYNYSKFTMHWI